MKHNITAINAIINGLKDGGCKCVTNFPGFNSFEIFQKLGGKQISLNEKTAFEIAFGASMAGKRSVVAMKSVGLNVSLDNYLHSVLHGINAGLVIVLTEDLQGIASPERQDSRPIRDILGGLWLEPFSIKSAYELVYDSFQISENLDMPIVIRLTDQFFKCRGSYQRKSYQVCEKPVENRRKKYISYWKFRDDLLLKRNKQVQNYIESLYSKIKLARKTDEAAIVIGKNSIKPAQKMDTLQIYTYPFPKKLIKTFLKGRKKIHVFEQGNDYAAKEISNILAGKNNVVFYPNNRIDQSDKWTIFNNQEKLFKALKSIHPSFVVGDEGSFTDESTKTINTCLCMGSSIGITMGMAMGGVKYPFCVIGDTSFMFEGIHTLIEAKHRNLRFCVIVIDNGGAVTTGGQHIIGNIYDLNVDIVQKTINYHDSNIDEFMDLLTKTKIANELSVIYVKY